MLHQGQREDVVARGHRRVRREAGARDDRLACRGEVEVLLFHQQANALQHAEGGVPFVHVADRRLLLMALQRADAADAQDHLLADAHVLVAAVKPGRDLPIFRVVLRDVRVEEIKRHRGPPESARCAATTSRPGIGTLTSSGVPSGLGFRNQRQIEEIVLGIAFLLPAVDVEVLAEVAFAVHQAHADERHAQVRGRLEMIARQQAETAGVDRDALVDAELGGEIGDAVMLGQRLRRPNPLLAVGSPGTRSGRPCTCRGLHDAIHVVPGSRRRSASSSNVPGGRRQAA